MMSDILKTPAAKWREEGQADPHGDHYNCQRAALTLGELTDDELANGVFLHGNEPLNINALLRKTPGYHSAVVWLNAGKDRIRWLSRALEESKDREQALQQRLNAADQRIDELTQPKAESETVWCSCGDGHAANSYGAGFMAANNGVCENCDAAKSQGEPSHEIPGTSGMRLNMLANQGE